MRDIILKSYIRRTFIMQKCPTIGEIIINELSNNNDWNSISKRNLTDDFIEEFQEKLNWDLLSQLHTLSRSFIKKYMNILNWKCVSMNKSLTDELIYIYKDKLDWRTISRYQNLSENLIDKYNHLLNWENISMFQNLSTQSIIKYKNNLNILKLLEYNKYFYKNKESHSIINWSSLNNTKLSKNFINKYSNYLNIDNLIKNKSIKISKLINSKITNSITYSQWQTIFQFRGKYCLRYSKIIKNPSYWGYILSNINLSEKFLIENIKSICEFKHYLNQKNKLTMTKIIRELDNKSEEYKESLI